MTVRQAIGAGWEIAKQASLDTGVDLTLAGLAPHPRRPQVPKPKSLRERTHALAVRCLACGVDIPVHEQMEHVGVCGGLK